MEVGVGFSNVNVYCEEDDGHEMDSQTIRGLGC